MNSVLSQMLEKYILNTKEDYLNALKEIVQEIALSALAKSDFFDHAAFYGGTALRIFYGLDRYSEDLDFSLLKKESFDLSKYFKIIENTFQSYGMRFQAVKKDKTVESNIRSAFLKGNTLEHILLIEASKSISDHIQNDEIIKIKFEIDVNPPLGANYEYKYRFLPIPYKVRLYDKESLFAGKLHAVICRGWKNRIKGRDLYDLIYYVSSNTQPNLYHLKQRLIESKKWNQEEELTIEKLRAMLKNRFREIDFNAAKEDVMRFINNPSKLDLWSLEFFESLVDLLN